MAYVYIHKRKDTGEVFYIGKGTGNRAWSTKRRNSYWWTVVNVTSYDIVILENDLTDEQAYKKEAEMILDYGLHNLTNIQPGGYGLTSSAASELNKKIWDVNLRKKVSLIKKEHWKRPEYRKVKSIQMKEYWSNNEIKEINSQKIKNALGTSDAKAKRSIISKDLWNDEAYRKNISEKNKRKVECSRCGKMIGICTLARHQKSSRCVDNYQPLG
jgi:hypothetical protein